MRNLRHSKAVGTGRTEKNWVLNESNSNIRRNARSSPQVEGAAEVLEVSDHKQETNGLKTRLKATWMAGDYDRFSRHMEQGARIFYEQLRSEERRVGKE